MNFFLSLARDENFHVHEIKRDEGRAEMIIESACVCELIGLIR